MKKGWLLIGIAGLILAVSLAARAAEEALAFITDVKGEGQVVRAGGKSEAVVMGSQLFVQDMVQVDKGRIVLIYLSGRSVEVEAGKTHKVEKGQGKSSPLMGRIASTLGEIAGPQSEIEKPVVHGMARETAGLNGALPANTRLNRQDFVFSWDPLEGVEEYVFTLETPSGEVLAQRTVKSTQLAARGLAMEPGRRYVWSVKEAASFLPRSSAQAWVEIAPDQEAMALHETLREVEKDYSGTTPELLKAAILYREGFYYDVERLLVELQRQHPLSEVERRMLMLAYARMGRWERLPAPEKSEKEPEKEKKE